MARVRDPHLEEWDGQVAPHRGVGWPERSGMAQPTRPCFARTGGPGAGQQLVQVSGAVRWGSIGQTKTAMSVFPPEVMTEEAGHLSLGRLLGAGDFKGGAG